MSISTAFFIYFIYLLPGNDLKLHFIFSYSDSGMPFSILGFPALHKLLLLLQGFGLSAGERPPASSMNETCTA